MTNDIITRARAVLDAASPGPLKMSRAAIVGTEVDGGIYAIEIAKMTWRSEYRADAQALILSRNTIAALLDVLAAELYCNEPNVHPSEAIDRAKVLDDAVNAALSTLRTELERVRAK